MEGLFVGIIVLVLFIGDTAVEVVGSVGLVQKAVGRVVIGSKFDAVVDIIKAVVVVVDAGKTDVVDSVGTTVISVGAVAAYMMPFKFFDNVCVDFNLLLLIGSDFITAVVVVGVIIIFTAAADVIVCCACNLLCA